MNDLIEKMHNLHIFKSSVSCSIVCLNDNANYLWILYTRSQSENQKIGLHIALFYSIQHSRHFIKLSSLKK